MSNIHSPETAFALATGLSVLVRLCARQGEAINALLAEYERAYGELPSSLGDSLAPGALLPDDNLLVLASELEVVAQRIRLRSRTLQSVRRDSKGDDKPDVSRETSHAGASRNQRPPRAKPILR